MPERCHPLLKHRTLLAGYLNYPSTCWANRTWQQLKPIWIGSAILNFSAKIIAEKDSLLAAMRVIAYSYVPFIIREIPGIGYIAVILAAISLAAQLSLRHCSPL
jgi:hypothetical protein